MAVVLPFRALRYDAQKVGGLERVLTQPYDKITPEMQREYWRRSPYNLARLTKGETRAGDSPSDNVYSRAAQSLRSWREQGILLQRVAPACYAYFQQFTLPGASGAAAAVRKGLVGLGQLEHYGSGVVFRHEQTLSAPKADRLELLRATRTHLESIFMLYSDSESRVESLLDEAAQGLPFAQVKDDYGVLHTLWDVGDAEKIRALQQSMSDKKLIIADGHHRYETALNFQQECQARHPARTEADCRLALMTFVNMDSGGIVILPTHRLIAGLPDWSAETFLLRVARYFTSVEYPFSSAGEAQKALVRLQADMQPVAEAAQVSLGALFQGKNAFCRFQLRRDVPLEQLLPELAPAERSLDVAILHRIAFGLCLGMDEESVRKERHLSYVRHFEEGVQSVRQGSAQACFFLNPVPIRQVREIAFQGRLLPQKSTDFYPKLLSGLVMHPMEH